MFSSNKNNILLVSILFVLIGIFLRIYQLNFENYWLDEMTSFWVADPNLSLEDTFTRNNHFHTPPIFDLFLKEYLLLFKYYSNFTSVAATVSHSLRYRFKILLQRTEIPVFYFLPYKVKFFTLRRSAGKIFTLPEAGKVKFYPVFGRFFSRPKAGKS